MASTTPAEPTPSFHAALSALRRQMHAEAAVWQRAVERAGEKADALLAERPDEPLSRDMIMALHLFTLEVRGEGRRKRRWEEGE